MVRARKPIYGCKNIASCDSDPPPIALLTVLRNIIDKFTYAIDKFFPDAKTNAPFTADMDATINVPPIIMVRLMWIKEHKGVKFDVHNTVHLNQIKDMYLRIGRDWEQDPLFPKRATGRRRRGQLL